MATFLYIYREVSFLQLALDPIKGKSSCSKSDCTALAILHAKSYKTFFSIKSLPGSLKFLSNGGPTRLPMLKGKISRPTLVIHLTRLEKYWFPLTEVVTFPSLSLSIIETLCFCHEWYPIQSWFPVDHHYCQLCKTR